MKIGIDLRILGNKQGGIGRYVFELALHLLQSDRLTQYFLFYNQNNAGEEELACFKNFKNAVLVPTKIRHYSFAEQISLPKILEKHKLDLVHFPNFNVPLRYKGRFVVTIHDMVHHKISGAKKSRLPHFWAYKKIIQNAALKSQSIITVSEYSKKEISKYLGTRPEKISVIYEGTNLGTNASEEKIVQVKERFYLSRPYFLFVGVLERKKNIINLTRGFDLFIKKYKLDMDLVLAGKADAHYPEIRFKAMDIKNRDRLVFTDYVEDADLAALYKGAYAFVSASLHEGFGLPGVEAMAFGLPLAVSNNEVFNEIYDNGAIYFDPLKPEDIADKMNLLVSDKLYYQRMQNNAIQRSSLFDWNKTAVQTLGAYKSATGGLI